MMEVLLTFTTEKIHALMLRDIIDKISRISLEDAFNYVITDVETKVELNINQIEYTSEDIDENGDFLDENGDILDENGDFLNELDDKVDLNVEVKLEEGGIKQEVNDGDTNEWLNDYIQDNEEEANGDDKVKVKPKVKKEVKVKTKVKKEVEGDSKLNGIVKKDKIKTESTYVKITDKKSRTFYKCNNCQKKFKTEKGFNRHECIDPEFNVCDICGKNGIVKMHEHKRNIHFKHTKKSTCPICGKFIFHVKKHIREVHEKKYDNVQCDDCGKQFKDMHALNCHRKIDHEGLEKTFSCDICNKSFYFESEMTTHKNYSHQRYQCDKCERIYSSKYTLKMHIEVDHESKPRAKFSCEHCDQIFKSKRAQQMHLKTQHLKTMDQICEHCGKAYSCIERKKKHIREVHLDSYKCHICGIEVANSYVLQTHINRHLKKYVCPQCKRAFGSLSKLKVHMNNVRCVRREFVSDEEAMSDAN